MKFSSALLVLFFVLPFLGYAQNKNGFEINGKISGLEEGEKITLIMFLGNFWTEHVDWIRIDSAYVKNEKFSLRGFAPQGLRFFWLKFDRHPDRIYRFITANNAKIAISSEIDIKKIPHGILDLDLKIENSRVNEVWHMLGENENVYFQCAKFIDNYLKRIKDSIGFDPSLVGGVIKSKQQADLGFINYCLMSEDTIVKEMIPFFIEANGLFYHTEHAALMYNVYNSLSDDVKKSYYGKILANRVQLCIGQPFPEFSLPDPYGKIISSGEIARKSKLTIVLFWATNSYTRQQYMDELIPWYNKYHEKGLNIIAVSSDTSAVKWKKMIEIEQYPWSNVSDLKGRDGVVEKLYKEYGTSKIPNTTIALVDSEGKIVAWDPLGIKLQWYLWKYLEN